MLTLMPFLVMSLVLSAAWRAAPLRCDRPAPEPAAFHSRGFGFVAEFFPPHSRQNNGDSPAAFVYEVGYPGTSWQMDARRLWTGPLVNPRFPQAALVSMQGDLVTLDDYDRPGEADAVVIYDRSGQLRRRFALTELLDSAALASVMRSDCGFHWREDAIFYFTGGEQPRLYIVQHRGRVLEFDLRTGAFRRAPEPAFPALNAILAREHPNEQTGIWRISLRFSSITDVARGRDAPEEP